MAKNCRPPIGAHSLPATRTYILTTTGMSLVEDSSTVEPPDKNTTTIVRPGAKNTANLCLHSDPWKWRENKLALFQALNFW